MFHKFSYRKFKKNYSFILIIVFIGMALGDRAKITHIGKIPITPNHLAILAVIIYVVFNLLFGYKYFILRSQRKIHLVFFLYAFLMIISLSWSPEVQRGLFTFIRIFTYMIFCLSFMAYLRNIDMNKIFQSLKICILLGIITSIIGIYEFISDNIVFLRELNVYSWGVRRAQSLFFDPNLFALFLGFIFAFLFSDIIIRKFSLLKFISIIIIIGGIFSSGSISGLVLIFTIIFVVSTRIILIKYRHLFIKLILSSIIILIATFILAKAINFDVYFAKRYKQIKSHEYALGGRLTLIKGGLSLFAKYPILGVGLEGFREKFKEVMPPEHKRESLTVSHTLLITVLAELGLIGILILILLFYKILKFPSLKRYLKPNNIDKKEFVLLIATNAFLWGYFVRSFSYGHQLFNTEFWVSIALYFNCLNYIKELKIKKKI